MFTKQSNERCTHCALQRYIIRFAVFVMQRWSSDSWQGDQPIGLSNRHLACPAGAAGHSSCGKKVLSVKNKPCWISSFANFELVLKNSDVSLPRNRFSRACSTTSNLVSFLQVLESCYGLGLMFGPPLGGCLYSLAGFFLPFWFSGVGFLTSPNP